MNKEIRSFTAPRPFTVRTLPDGSKQVSGYAIVFNSPSVDLGGFVETCDAGMLTRTLRENPDVLILRDHKSELLLGRTTAGTLSLSVDSTGLRFVCTLPNGPTGQDAAEAITRRDITACSFGFNCVEDAWTRAADGSALRTLLDVDLFEISITSFPAYQETSVEARSRAKRAWDGEDDLDDDDDDDADAITTEDECNCRCERCLTGRCERCIRSECSDSVCYDNGCAMPGQDDNRSDRMRIARHFNSAHLNLYR